MRNFGVNEFDNKFRIIGDSKLAQPDLSKHTAQETVFEVFHKIVIQNCEKKEYLLDLKKYLLDYLVDKIHIDHFKKKKAPYPGKPYTSLNGTKVRSKSEQHIADWLFRHSIRFVYEPNVNFKDFDFRPDFFIPDANVYLEHVSNKSYSMRDKEQQFKKVNKLLVKTYEKQTENTALFNLVLERIIKNRLPENHLMENPLHFEEEFRYYHKEIKDFIRSMIQVTDMIKVENLEIENIKQTSQNDPHERVRSFYKLALPIIKQYKQYCVNKSYLDFNDMISRTISLFKNHPEIAAKYKEKYQYILVDEFQDVNNLQVDLLKLLLGKDCQLFCVGDDWQSIYGFRGSNVGYIVNFNEYFQNAATIKLSLNYRSSKNIVGASNEVIKNNKFKIDKHVESLKQSNSKITVYAGRNIEENVDFVFSEIDKLQKEKNYSKDDILILYRRTKMFSKYFERSKQEKFFITGKTIHASKGLEAKAVFIIGLTEGKGGFPDIWMEDRIFQIIKKSKHDFLLEEERRLFYVAITRAKDQLYLMTEKGNESSFIREIPDNFTFKTSLPFKSVVESIKLCDHCEKQIEPDFAFCPNCGEKTDG